MHQLEFGYSGCYDTIGPSTAINATALGILRAPRGLSAPVLSMSLLTSAGDRDAQVAEEAGPASQDAVATMEVRRRAGRVNHFQRCVSFHEPDFRAVGPCSVGDGDAAVAEEAGPASQDAVATLEVRHGAGRRILRALRWTHAGHRPGRRPHGARLLGCPRLP